MDTSIRKRFDNVSKSKTFRNILTKYGLNSKCVLDIGCTHGEFLAHFGKGSRGLTLDEHEARIGRGEGLYVDVLNIEEDYDKITERYDVIFANNIFEHMQSPHNFLINIKTLIKPDGILILGVPCIPYLTFLMRFKKFRGALASLHINFFNRTTLIKTVEYAGWRIKEVRGFRFKSSVIDYLLNPIYPHFYVVADINDEFRYSEKRLRELEGYNK